MSVCVLWGGRTCKVKTTPQMSLAVVRDQACSNFSLASESYTLYRDKKALDLGVPFRLSGVPNNARIELKASEQGGVVNIALQFSNQRLLLGTHPPAKTTLWDLLILVSQQQEGLNFTTSVSPEGTFLQPVVWWMSRKISSMYELHESTLLQLGICSGNALLRVTLEDTQQPREVVMKSVDEEKRRQEEQKLEREQQLQQQKEKKREFQLKLEQEERKKEELTKVAIYSDFSEAVQRERAQKVQKEQRQKEEEFRRARELEQEIAEERRKIQLERKREVDFIHQTSTPLPSSPKSANHQKPALSPDELQILVFPPSDNTKVDTSFLDSIPDEFYDVTPSDFKTLSESERARKRKQELDKAVLKTKSMREREALERWSKFRKCSVRIRFPDRIEVQRAFHVLDTLYSVYAFLREQCLAHPQYSFYLYSTPPPHKFTEPELSKTFGELNLLPASLLHFSYSDKNVQRVAYPFIRPQLMEKVSARLDPNFFFDPEIITATVQQAAAIHNQEVSQTLENQPDVEMRAQDDTNEEQGPPSRKKVPKWFLAGKKL